MMNQADKLYDKDSQLFGDKLFKSCREGNGKFIDSFIQSKIIKEYVSPSTIWQMIDESATKGHLNIIKKVFDCRDLGGTVKQSIAIEHTFRAACSKGHVNIIEYLFDNGYLEELPNYMSMVYAREAIRHNHFDMIKFLLKWDGFLSLEKQSASCLNAAIEFNRVELIKDLIENIKDDTDKSYIYNHLESVFGEFKLNYRSTCELFVLELNLEKNETLENFMKEDSYLAKLYKLKELNNNLHQDLENNTNTKKSKNKL